MNLILVLIVNLSYDRQWMSYCNTFLAKIRILCYANRAILCRARCWIIVRVGVVCVMCTTTRWKCVRYNSCNFIVIKCQNRKIYIVLITWLCYWTIVYKNQALLCYVIIANLTAIQTHRIRSDKQFIMTIIIML